jgi:hypothetical protein
MLAAGPWPDLGRSWQLAGNRASCQTPWFYRFHEYVTFAGPDDLTSWFTGLNDEEAERIRATEDPAALDLGFLGTRPSWMHDGQGPRQVPGQPGHPWS